jgi:hypothetical protein
LGELSAWNHQNVAGPIEHLRCKHPVWPTVDIVEFEASAGGWRDHVDGLSSISNSNPNTSRQALSPPENDGILDLEIKCFLGGRVHVFMIRASRLARGIHSPGEARSFNPSCPLVPGIHVYPQPAA